MDIHDISLYKWIFLVFCALTIGMTKTGLSGVNMPSVIFLALIFGGKASSGLVLPMLIIADVFGVVYYIKNTNFKYVLVLMPYTILGIFIALFIGKNISNNIFNILISIVILIGLVFMIFRNKKASVPTHWSFPAAMGTLSGFSSMIGNSASSIMALYLLSMKLPKNNFIGTSAVFFAAVNLIKLPLHVIYWHTITYNSLLIDILMAPAIALGALIGILIVKKIPEKPYRYFIITASVVSVVVLIVRSLMV
ncbi:MAG: sulfite exporter TauE/SafE family protein [Spirochaetes bacterium]|nr:sulfite exporter TauE/SafE family protein [Spirochaetota bacterium]